MSPARGFAGDLEKAASLEQAGKISEAVATYDHWLETSPASATWDKTLFHAVSLMSDPEQALATLIHAIPKLSSDASRHEVYVRIARLDLLVGDWTGAQQSFDNASLVPGPKDFHSLLESARILIQLGELQKADAQLRSIVAVCQDQQIVMEARVALFTARAAGGQDTQLAAEIERFLGSSAANRLTAQALAELHTVGVRLGDRALQTRLQGILDTRFPKSPEAAVIAGKAAKFPSPANLLGFAGAPYEGSVAQEQPAATPAVPAGSSQPASTAPATPTTGKVIAVQIGSYLDPSNATYRLKDLHAAGFAGKIVKAELNGKTYYKVIVPNVPLSESQTVVTQLKEKGFEGFLLYN